LSCPVQVTYWPTCPVLYLLSCPNCPVPDVLSKMSCPGCPFLAALLFLLPCLGHIGYCFPDTIVMSWQSFHLCPFQARLSRLPVGPPCRDCTIPTVLSLISCPTCPVRVVLSQMSCPRCHLLDVLSQLAWLFYPSYPVLAGCPVPDVLPQLPWLFHPSCRVLAVLSLLSYSDRFALFPILAVLSCLPF
jgi:hypothetical protein